jgi:hypothetical protein
MKIESANSRTRERFFSRLLEHDSEASPGHDPGANRLSDKIMLNQQGRIQQR